VTQEGATQAKVEVEPWVLPAGVGAEVGGKSTVAAGADADAATDAAADAGEVGRWGHDDTPSGTSWEHYRMELSQPFSSLSPCGRRSHHP
jgi:hypothetical protein